MSPARQLICLLWFFIGCAGLAVLALLPRYRYEISHIFGRRVSPVALKILGIEVEVRNRERLRTRQPRILLPNHQHNIDIFIIASLLEPKTITVGKRSLRWIPLFGWLFRWTGNLFIDRSTSADAMKVMDEARRQIVDRGLSVVIAPEGTRSHGRGLLPFKKGAFHLAVGAGLPLQPIAISTFYGKAAHSDRVIIDILESIPTAGIDRAEVPNLMATTFAAMQAAIARLDAELSAEHGRVPAS
jgi:1-acyl-sn-glycerol-3-phosphate acyltransferase